jgi:hypothetical protein
MNPIEITRASHRAVMPSSFATAQAGVRPAADCRYRTTSACLHLPPYSPGLIPVENVSQYLRENQVSNRVFANYDTVVEHAAKQGTPSWPFQTASLNRHAIMGISHSIMPLILAGSVCSRTAQKVPSSQLPRRHISHRTARRSAIVFYIVVTRASEVRRHRWR